mmetsp:Transcript_5773/g.12577  ORF Transcript_5773/g.12577 Transcript_5773/m.12577 type:complete len:200 (+) Transcript_5773:366-965(+)
MATGAAARSPRNHSNLNIRTCVLTLEKQWSTRIASAGILPLLNVGSAHHLIRDGPKPEVAVALINKLQLDFLQSFGNRAAVVQPAKSYHRQRVAMFKSSITTTREIDVHHASQKNGIIDRINLQQGKVMIERIGTVRGMDQGAFNARLEEGVLSTVAIISIRAFVRTNANGREPRVARIVAMGSSQDDVTMDKRPAAGM